MDPMSDPRIFFLALLLTACTNPTTATLRDVDLFQSVQVPLIRDHTPVLTSDRTAPIIAGRQAVLRARLDVPADWTATDLTLQVELTSWGETHSFEATVEDPPSDLIVAIPADAITPTTRYTLTLSEDNTVHERYPDDGEASLDPQTTGPLDLRLVPFEVNGFTPDTSPAVLNGLRDALFAVYPVTDVVISVAEVQVWEGEPDLGDINVRVGELQETAMIAGEVSWRTYYYGMVTGVASREAYEGITGTSEHGGDQELVRAYFAAGAAFGDQRSEDTLIHELGHVHGLLHAPCDGEDNTDPGYPYAEGAIGVEGWDLRTGTFVPADAKDMMAYCYPRWISDYNYAKVADHVEAAQSYAGYE
jgi:hypothetical protein